MQSVQSCQEATFHCLQLWRRYCTALYFNLLYCTLLYCTVLYCTVLYCTVLYCRYEARCYCPDDPLFGARDELYARLAKLKHAADYETVTAADGTTVAEKLSMYSVPLNRSDWSLF